MSFFPVSSTSDLYITPFLSQLQTLFQTQISPAPSVVYTLPPDGQPEHNSVVITTPEFDDTGSTLDKRELTFHLNIIHFTAASSRVADDFQNCYNWFSAYVNVLDAWKNQNLSGTSREVTLKKGRVDRIQWDAIPMIVLFMKVDVVVEFNPYAGT